MRNELGNGAPETPTERTRRRWNRMAQGYDRRGDRAERWLIGDTRAWLCGQATGRTLEVAVGTGRNLDFYRDEVALTGLDLSTEMLTVARRRATALDLRVDLKEGDSQALPFNDGDFDTVVCTLALCTIPNQRAAVNEMHRVLRPEGRLLLVDHVEYTRVPLRWVERLRAAPRTRPLDLVRENGFTVDHHDRLALGLVDRVVARR
ncbi:ubiquinone/menaquinone biosynthesis C-methylase UbiE [Lipingzhangella halophila]|uniref:Ubiquinone/menaquinone biosynthesis C-methylase UbiE n=1 Tax=Lipingzhangella halophila TaxID=1783352 RepID=A0A7W7RML7_9ACTN|nr:class I SAM-dependent methyltransferase [Lipingzhangella halophila]MBB4934226.1 ubiquinone/menaquinone biosynthesis C-methylase UbiE [Lipingzhangella halophila]